MKKGEIVVWVVWIEETSAWIYIYAVYVKDDL